jgi:hypothetical protein
MTRTCSSIVALAWLFAGCRSSAGDAAPPMMLPADSVVLELDGKAFQAGCADGHSGSGFTQGATCGSAAIGAGPNFHTIACDNSQAAPAYFLGTEFRNLDAAVSGDLTFDLSDPAHEGYVTVMMNYMDESRTEYHYCTAPPREADGGAYPASSGIVTLHRFVAEPDAPPGVAISDAEITNAIVPSLDGGPAITIVAAHLYFE